MQGSFCTVHFKEANDEKHRSKLYESIRGAAADAMSAWERSQVELALQRSVDDDEEARQQAAQGIARVEPRLRRLSLVRTETEALGNCQFAALTQTAGLSLTPHEFRQQVVDYLRPLGDLFGEKMEGRFHGNYEGYLHYMATDCSWGDSLTRIAAAHLLMRPIVLVTDSASDQEVVINPPDILAQECWGHQLCWRAMWTNTMKAHCPLTTMLCLLRTECLCYATGFDATASPTAAAGSHH